MRQLIVACLAVALVMACDEVNEPDPNAPAVTLSTRDTTLDPLDTLSMRFETRNVSDERGVFESSDTAIAIVDGRGLVTALRRGSAIIRVSLFADRTVRDSFRVSVRPPSIRILSAPTTLEELERGTLEVKISSYDHPRINIVSTDDGVLQPVSRTAIPEGIRANRVSVAVDARVAGSATIAVLSAGEPSVMATTTITVVPRTVARVEITPATASVFGTGRTVQLRAIAYDRRNLSFSERPTMWQSATPAIATVSSTGLVTTVSPGSATITADIDGVRGSSTLTVAPMAHDSVSVVAGQSILVPVLANDWTPSGSTLTLVRTGTPLYGSVRIEGVSLRYTPSAGYVGADSVAYVAATDRDTVSATLVVGVKPALFDVVMIEPHGVDVVPMDINEHGDVAGYYVDADSTTHAFRWSRGTFIPLGTLDGRSSRATVINDLGDVGGGAGAPLKGAFDPVIWRAASTTPQILNNDQCYPTAINERVQVLLCFSIWESDGTPGAREISMVDLNDRGDVLAHTLELYPKTYVARNGARTFVQGFGGRWTRGFEMNDEGTVIGLGERSPGQGGLPFIWRETTGTQRLERAYGPSVVQPFLVNDDEWVIVNGPALWVNGAVFTMDQLVVEPERWRVESINAINDRGQMAGVAIDLQAGTRRGVVLTPR
jgi:probable HAF family extracellular repeat protein